MKSLTKTVILALVLQAAIYLFLDRYLLVPEAAFVQQTISQAQTESVDLSWMSSDQKYWAEVGETGVAFYGADNQLVKEEPLLAEEEVTCFAWAPGSHLALIATTQPEARGVTVTLKSVNVDFDNMPVEPKISGLARESMITAVAFSAQTNVTYLLISGPVTNMIYRTDANNRLTRVLSNANIKRIACLQSIDTLLLYNQADKTIYTRKIKGFSKLSVPPEGKYALIGTDHNDFIYIGRLNYAGLVTEILQGSINGDFTFYKAMIHPTEPEAIHVDYEGQLRIEMTSQII
ncbi:MAG: hypothetical protein ABRQ23_05575 [Syntrophomonadaceae bacterium]